MEWQTKEECIGMGGRGKQGVVECCKLPSLSFVLLHFDRNEL